MGNFTFSDMKKACKVYEPKGKYAGKIMCAHHATMKTLLNYTGELGSVVNMYYALTFSLLKEGFQVQKFNETMEISSVHQQYYQLVHRQKEELEGKIKAGLASVSQAVADYELAQHDLREYKKFLELDENGEPVLDEKTKKPKLTTNEHTLKTIFVQQVDYHTGDASGGGGAGRLSMEFLRNNNIMPTIVDDFMVMDSKDDLKKDKFKNIATVEKNLLKTKWDAYKKWEKIFLKEVLERYARIRQLVAGREKSIEEYRNWLKPYIARHKLLKEGLESSDSRKSALTSFISSSGRATSSNAINLWIWIAFSIVEFFKADGEMLAKKPVEAYDKYAKELIFNTEWGLNADYPWITEKWVKKKINEIYEDKWMKKDQLYYVFITVDLDRTNMKSASGSELEDGDFNVTSYMLTQNAMLVKLLELKAKQEDFERDVNEFLGITNEMPAESPVTEKKKNPLEQVGSFLSSTGLSMKFFKTGPYERDMQDRLTKFYFKPMAVDYYGKVTSLLKGSMKIGD